MERFAGVLIGLALVCLATSARAELDPVEAQLRVALEGREAQMRSTLAEWVEVNTGSFNLPGLESFAGLLEAELTRLGFEVERSAVDELDYPGRGTLRTGPLLVARRASSSADAPHFMLSGHYDTVFEPDAAFQKFAIDPNHADRAIGPGVADMKGGLIVMLQALYALSELGDLDKIRWTIVLNADEELGSLGSRTRIEAEAREADLGFVFESARQTGAMVKSRRGLGQFFLSVHGVAAHAGSAHEQGRSAIAEMAHQIVAIEGLTSYDDGVTLNVGTVQGGAKRNIVPEKAEAWIDLRYDAFELGERARDQLEQIAQKPSVPGTRTTVWGTLHRPPKLGTDATGRLLDAHTAVAEDLGLAAPPAIHAGGGTDGSLMAHAGLTTLDSMGVRGGAAHTDREFVVLASLPERAAVAAILFRRLLYADLAGR